jgi:chemotaxis protein histidine kinase CheA
MSTSPELQQIFEREARRRVEEMRVALSQTGTHDLELRERSLYDAHLQAHTLKGTAEQLGHIELAHCAGAMSDHLEVAREKNLIPVSTVDKMEQGLNLVLAWVEAHGSGYNELLESFAEDFGATVPAS